MRMRGVLLGSLFLVVACSGGDDGSTDSTPNPTAGAAGNAGQSGSAGLGGAGGSAAGVGGASGTAGSGAGGIAGEGGAAGDGGKGGGAAGEPGICDTPQPEPKATGACQVKAENTALCGDTPQCKVTGAAVVECPKDPSGYAVSLLGSHASLSTNWGTFAPRLVSFSAAGGSVQDALFAGNSAHLVPSTGETPDVVGGGDCAGVFLFSNQSGQFQPEKITQDGLFYYQTQHTAAGSDGRAIIGYHHPGSFKTVVAARQPGAAGFVFSEHAPANRLRVTGSSKGVSIAYTPYYDSVGAQLFVLQAGGEPAGLYPDTLIASFGIAATEALFEGQGVVAASLPDGIHVRYPDGHETVVAAVNPTGCPEPGKIESAADAFFCDMQPVQCTQKGTGALPTTVSVVRTNDGSLHLVYIEQERDRDVTVNSFDGVGGNFIGGRCGVRIDQERSKSVLVVARIEADGAKLTREATMPVSPDQGDGFTFLASGGDGAVHLLEQGPNGLPLRYRVLSLQ